MKNTPLVSIAICTYGAAKYLSEVIQALATQTLSDFELIIIDNNPARTDRLTSLLDILPAGKARLIYCSRPGLSNARNLAIRKSAGHFIAFLDDDAIPDKDWLKNFVETIQKYRPVMIGGRIELVIEDRASGWFLCDKKLRRYLSELCYEKEIIKEIRYPQYIVGANMMFDRRVFDKYGFFSEKFGKKGKKQYFGEETEFLRRLLNNKERVSYTGGAYVRHIVSAKRARLKFLARRAFNQGSSDKLIDKIHGPMFPGCPYNPYLRIARCLGDFLLCRRSFQHLTIDVFRNLGYIFDEIPRRS